jgi:hypothetical protein
MNFEANAQNLQALGGRLQETLSSEDQVRKDGKKLQLFHWYNLI